MTKNIIIMTIYWINILPMMLILILLTNKSHHPMIMLMSLIVFTLTSCAFVSKYLSSYYFSYLMFMVTIGGTLIIFMYMVSLTNKDNYNIKLSKNELIYISIISMLIMITFTLSFNKNYLSMIFNYSTQELMNLSLFIYNYTPMTISMMYMNTYKLTLLCITLLLIMLLSVVKLCSKHKGALRQIK